MGGKCFAVKIEEEQFSMENLGIIPVGHAGNCFPDEGGLAVVNREGVRRLSDASDIATQEDSYERAGMSVEESASPISLKPNFEYLAESMGVNRERYGSIGRKNKASDKLFEGDLGQVKSKGSSKVKSTDELGIVGPLTESSSAVMGCVQTEGTVSGLDSKGIRGSLKNQSETLRCKQNSELRKLEDDIAKVLEKGLALGHNFNGRKEELMDIIAKRNERNDNRYRDLVRRLMLNFKANGC